MASRVSNLHKYQHPTALYLLEDFYVFFFQVMEIKIRKGRRVHLGIQGSFLEGLT